MRRFGRWAVILLMLVATPVAVAEDRAVVTLLVSGETEPPASDSEPATASLAARVARPTAPASRPLRPAGVRPTAARPRPVPPFQPHVRLHVLCCVWRE